MHIYIYILYIIYIAARQDHREDWRNSGFGSLMDDQPYIADRNRDIRTKWHVKEFLVESLHLSLGSWLP